MSIVWNTVRMLAFLGERGGGGVERERETGLLLEHLHASPRIKGTLKFGLKEVRLNPYVRLIVGPRMALVPTPSDVWSP